MTTKKKVIQGGVDVQKSDGTSALTVDETTGMLRPAFPLQHTTSVLSANLSGLFCTTIDLLDDQYVDITCGSACLFIVNVKSTSNGSLYYGATIVPGTGAVLPAIFAGTNTSIGATSDVDGNLNISKANTSVMRVKNRTGINLTGVTITIFGCDSTVTFTKS